MQKDMVPILTAEGYTVTGRELMRIRAKHKWFLRRPNGSTGGPSELDNDDVDLSGLTDAPEMVQDPMQDFQQHTAPFHEGQPQEHQLSQLEPPAETGLSSLLNDHNGTPDGHPEEILDRRERYRRRKMDSDTKWQSRKRRRHTIDRAGMPADPPGPPRYPSETTLGEVQGILQLDKNMYWDMRAQFEDICRQRGIVKKTSCGPEQWQSSKDYLVQTNVQLQQVFQTADQTQIAPLQLSLDVVCMDVTKHIRNTGKSLTLAEAKNILGINPDQARVLRDSLMAILAANNFVNTFESDNLGELKEQWLEETGLKHSIPIEEGPERERMIKSVNLLCREIMKRWREEQAKRDPNKAPVSRTTNSDGSSVPKLPRRRRGPAHQQQQQQQQQQQPDFTAQALPDVGVPDQDRQDEQIDPSLLLAANNHSLLDDTEPIPAPYPLPDATSAPIPAYFRLHPQSTAQGASSLWLGALAAPTLHNLQVAALSCRGGHLFQIGRIEGVVGSPAAPEMVIQIDHDDELQAYLDHVGAGKATFMVLLQ